MTLTRERAATALRALSPAEINNITEMQAPGDEGWEKIVTSLRNAVADAYAEGRFDTEYPSDVVREIADGQVPVYNRQRMDELLIVGAAWTYETESTGSLLDVIGLVLLDVYADGAQYLVNWVNEQDDPEDEEDDEEEADA